MSKTQAYYMDRKPDTKPHKRDARSGGGHFKDVLIQPSHRRLKWLKADPEKLVAAYGRMCHVDGECCTEAVMLGRIIIARLGGAVL